MQITNSTDRGCHGGGGRVRLGIDQETVKVGLAKLS